MDPCTGLRCGRPPPCRQASREVTHEPVLTAPNTITVVRTVVSLVLAMTALAQSSAELLVAAYLVYFLGDGEVARRLGLETRIGAVFGIVADRANSLTCAACFVALDPRMAAPLAIYIVEFAVVAKTWSCVRMRALITTPALEMGRECCR